MAAGKVSHNTSIQSASGTDSKTSKSSYTHSTEITAKPAAQNMNFSEWKERVMKQKKGWIIIGKKVQTEPIIKVLFREKNIPVDYLKSEEKL